MSRGTVGGMSGTALWRRTGERSERFWTCGSGFIRPEAGAPQKGVSVDI